MHCEVLCSLGTRVVEDEYVFAGIHSRSNTCSGGLPIMALLPHRTIGLSMRIGFAIMALTS